MNIGHLRLSKTLERYLENVGITTIEQLQRLDRTDLTDIPGIGFFYSGIVMNAISTFHERQLLRAKVAVADYHPIPNLAEEEGTVFLVKLSKKTNTYDCSDTLAEDLGLTGSDRQGKICDFAEVWRCSFGKFRDDAAGYGLTPGQAYDNARMRRDLVRQKLLPKTFKDRWGNYRKSYKMLQAPGWDRGIPKQDDHVCDASCGAALDEVFSSLK